jgi:hypothetical protein
MPAEGIILMLRLSTPFISHYAFRSTPSPPAVKQDAMKPVLSSLIKTPQRLQRQGLRADEWIPKNISSNAKSLLANTLEWAEVNEEKVTPQNVKELATAFELALSKGEGQVMTDIKEHLGVDESHQQYKSLKGNLSNKIKGSGKISNIVKWLLTIEYLPSSLMMLYVTNGIYNEMQARQKITADEKKVLMRQEIARQGVGSALHVARTLVGFESVVWVMNLMKRHPNVRQTGERLMKQTTPLQKQIGKGLVCTAHHMQKTWNTLYGDANQTVASIASLMLINVLTYGVTRPLMVNAAFYGLHTSEEEAALEAKNEKIAKKS